MTGDDASLRIWQTIENMRTLDASLGAFDRILEKQLEEKFSVEWIKGTGGTHGTDNSWVEYAYWYACKLKGQPLGASRKKCVGAATFKIELWRSVGSHHSAWRHARTPLIYIAFCPDQKRPWEEVGLDQFGNPVAEDGIGIECPQSGSNWLWEWTKNKPGARWRKRSWFFAVPLTALDSDESIGAEIVKPLEDLVLTEMSPAEIFKDKRAIQITPKNG